jgi:hypothetical protein
MKEETRADSPQGHEDFLLSRISKWLSPWLISMFESLWRDKALLPSFVASGS